MKATFGFDPAACDYGPATAAVRSILTEWAAVDWFSPPRTDPHQDLAVQLFREHNEKARVHQPDLFPVNIEVQQQRGDWEGFGALCKQVRAHTDWDWKFSALKQLSHRHSKALGWNLKDQGRRPQPHETRDAPHTGHLFARIGAHALKTLGWKMKAQARQPQEFGALLQPGDLFARVGDGAFWTISPQLNLSDTVPGDQVEFAQWYMSYANMDFIECIEWQLAEKSDSLDANPFLPLVRCYVAGFYPFSLGRSAFSLYTLA